MDHTLHTPLEAAEINESNLIGAVIYGPMDEKIGSVAHVHGTDAVGAGSDLQVIVDVGGFLGIGAKPVAIAASQLRFMRSEDGSVHAVTTWTKAQIHAFPEHHH